MKTEIFPMGEEHLDSLAELEKFAFHSHGQDRLLQMSLKMIVRFFRC